MRTVIRRSVRLLGIAAMALLLSGCLKLTQDLTLNEDDTVDGEIVFAVSKSFLELSGVTTEDFLDQMTQGEGPLPEGVEYDTEPYEDDEYVGNRYSFEGAPLSTFSGTEGTDLSIVREGDMFVVSGTLDATSEEIDPSGIPGGEDVLDSFDVRISITFPGAVESASGEIEGNTVTWTPALGETTDISARGSAVDDGGGGGALAWILLGAIVVLGVVALVVAFGRTKRGAPAEAATEAPAGAAIPPTPGEAMLAAATEAQATEAPATDAPPPPPAPVTEPVPAPEPTSDLPDAGDAPATAEAPEGPEPGGGDTAPDADDDEGGSA
jgi:hypothetical protein